MTCQYHRMIFWPPYLTHFLWNHPGMEVKNHELTLVQVMDWCRQAISHYLSQYWPRSMSPFAVTSQNVLMYLYLAIVPNVKIVKSWHGHTFLITQTQTGVYSTYKHIHLETSHQDCIAKYKHIEKYQTHTIKSAKMHMIYTSEYLIWSFSLI